MALSGCAWSGLNDDFATDYHPYRASNRLEKQARSLETTDCVEAMLWQLLREPIIELMDLANAWDASSRLLMHRCPPILDVQTGSHFVSTKPSQLSSSHVFQVNDT